MCISCSMFQVDRLAVRVTMTSADSQEERGLVAGLVQRDQGALGKLYDRYAPQVYALCLRILSRPEEAQETVLESFHQVWQQAKRYDGRGSVHAWIFTIARSRAIDRLRARQRLEGHEQTLDLGAVAPQTADPGPTPEQVTLNHDRREQIMRALSTLPEAQRQAIELSYFGGYSHSEIAERLQQPLGTIKTRIHLGVKALRNSLSLAWSEESR